MLDLASALLPAPLASVDAPRALMQSAEFAGALHHCRQTPLILDRLDRTLVLRRRLRPGFPVAMLPRATIRKPLRLLEILQEEGLKRTPVVISPDHPVPELGALGAIPLFSPAHLAFLDLSGGAGSVRAGMTTKWRNRLVRAENGSIRVTRSLLPQEPNHWLLNADARQQQTRGYSNWPARLTLAFARENPGHAQVFTAWENDKPVAAILLLLHGNVATYHIGHTTDAGRAGTAHNLLFWNAIEWLCSHGFTHLDLGVINTEDAPGLARFKLGMGAETRQLGGTWMWWPPVGRRLRFLAALDRRQMTQRNAGQNMA